MNKDLAIAHMQKGNWTVYTLAAELEVKASEIYLQLDFETRLMFVRQGRLLKQHSLEGLIDEPEPQPDTPTKRSRSNPRSLFDKIFSS